MTTFYKSLVFPTIEYCSVLWSSNAINLIQRMEKIQVLAAQGASLLNAMPKRIRGLKNISVVCFKNAYEKHINARKK